MKTPEDTQIQVWEQHVLPSRRFLTEKVLIVSTKHSQTTFCSLYKSTSPGDKPAPTEPPAQTSPQPSDWTTQGKNDQLLNLKYNNRDWRVEQLKSTQKTFHVQNCPNWSPQFKNTECSSKKLMQQSSTHDNWVVTTTTGGFVFLPSSSTLSKKHFLCFSIWLFVCFFYLVTFCVLGIITHVLETGPVHRTGVCYLVDTEDRCGELLAQIVQCGRDRQYLFGPLQPISSLELTPEQGCHWVDHQEPDHSPGQQKGDATRETHPQGVLQVKQAHLLQHVNHQKIDQRWAEITHQVCSVFHIHMVTELEPADQWWRDVRAKRRLVCDQLLQTFDGEWVLSADVYCSCRETGSEHIIMCVHKAFRDRTECRPNRSLPPHGASEFETLPDLKDLQSLKQVLELHDKKNQNQILCCACYQIETACDRRKFKISSQEWATNKDHSNTKSWNHWRGHKGN